jgi:hypothetical protein
MSSAAQTQANRENSQKSTGAATAAGQQTSSQNATKHGLTSRNFHIMADEDASEFQELVTNLADEYLPHTQTETDLIFRMAQHEWLRARALRLQDLCLEPGRHVSSPEHFSLYLRYQTSNERAYSRCLKDLLMLRAEERKEQIGFVSQERGAALEQRAAEAHNLKKEALNLKKQEFERKAQRATRPQPSPVPQNASTPHPETGPGDLKMAA